MGPGVRTGQLIVAEVTGAAVVGSVFAPRWVLIGVAILAAAVLVATFGRVSGRWWWEVVVLARRFRRRRSLAAAQVLSAAVDGGPVPVAWLRTLAPALTLRPVTVGTQTVAVGADGDGWFGVVELGPLWGDEPPPSVGADPVENPWAPEAGTVRLLAGAPVPYRDLATLLDQVSAVQVVLTPGPTPDGARPAWVAVRILPGDALATERAGGVSAIERTVAAAVVKAVRTLETAGWTARPVAPDGLLPVLVEATGLNGPPQEQWSWWRAGRGVRTHYAVHGWTPAHGTLAAGVTYLAVHFQRRLRSGGGGYGQRRLRSGGGGYGQRRLRSGSGEHDSRGTPESPDPVVLAAVATAPPALRRTCQEVVTAAAARAVRLRPLDGEQAPAAWALAPTAAPLPAR